MKSAASKELQDIFSVLPKRAKAEAIDYMEYLSLKYGKDRTVGAKQKAFKVIDGYRGTIKKWTREELYER